MTENWQQELTRLAAIVEGLGQEHLELKCAVALGIMACTALVRGAAALEHLAAAAVATREPKQSRAELARMAVELERCTTRDEMHAVLRRWGF